MLAGKEGFRLMVQVTEAWRPARSVEREGLSVNGMNRRLAANRIGKPAAA